MSERLTLADRLVGLLRVADLAKEEIEKCGGRYSDDPRFAMTMIVDEQLNGVANAFMVAYGNVERVQMLAIRWREAYPPGAAAVTESAARSAESRETPSE